MAQRRLNMLLLAVFAAIATILAAIGIYGVMAYGVTQRFHEIGIRMALGAEPSDVLKMVVTDGMKLAVTGLLIGIVGAALLIALSRKSALRHQDHRSVHVCRSSSGPRGRRRCRLLFPGAPRYQGRSAFSAECTLVVIRAFGWKRQSKGTTADSLFCTI